MSDAKTAVDASTNRLESGLANLRRASGVLLLVALAGYLWSVHSAPVDQIQGVIQKILYVHVPCAFAAYAGFVCTALGGGLYLWRRQEIYDRFAGAAAEVGVLFCTLVIITGPIWARGTWGRWWSWDLRLTLTLFLFLMYVSYLLLRSFTEDSERGARFSALYGISGLAIIPLNYFAIDLADGRTIHPENLGSDSLGDGMVLPFVAGIVTVFVAFVYLLAARFEVGTLRARVTEVPTPGEER